MLTRHDTDILANTATLSTLRDYWYMLADVAAHGRACARVEAELARCEWLSSSPSAVTAVRGRSAGGAL
jgi:hypothetical protein